MQELQTEIKEKYLCAYSKKFMKDPVLAQDGDVYERDAIEDYFAELEEQGKSIVSPISQAPINKQLIPRNDLAKKLRKLLQLNPGYEPAYYFSERNFKRAIHAIQTNNVELLKQCIEKDKRILIHCTNDNPSLMEWVCEVGNDELIAQFFTAQNQCYPHLTINGDVKLTLLLKVFQRQGIESGLKLLNYVSFDDRKSLLDAMMTAIENNNLELLEMLVTLKLFNINKAIDAEGNTLLHIAIQKNKWAVVEEFIKWGAEAKQKNKSGITPLDQVADRNYQQQIKSWRTEKKLEPWTHEILRQQQRIESQEHEIKRLLISVNALLETRERQQKNMMALERQILLPFIPEFSQETGRGNLNRLKSMLQEYPNLALQYVDITDTAGCKFERLTALQYCYWAIDNEACALFAVYLSPEEALRQLNEFEEQRQDIHRQYERHFNHARLLQAYQGYMAACNKSSYYSGSNKEIFDSWKTVGQAQATVPAWFIYLFSEEGANAAWPTGNFEQTVERREKYLNEWYGRKENYSSSLKIGENCAVYRHLSEVELCYETHGVGHGGVPTARKNGSSESVRITQQDCDKLTRCFESRLAAIESFKQQLTRSKHLAMPKN